MNEHTLKVLEYDKVRSIVASHAASEAGRRKILEQAPCSDEQSVMRLLSETREFMCLLQSGEKPPLDGLADVGPVISKLSASGIVLSPAELLTVAMTLAAGRRVKKFFERFDRKGGDSALAAPLLCARAAAIRTFKGIEEAVLAAIDEKAEVRDSASPELRKTRKQIVRTREDILNRMSRILQDSGLQKVIQEPVITQRDDRYVLPLKPNYRQSLSGVVHAQSGSRATLFVEPLDVLEQNNRLAELRVEERDEVERILRALTALLAAETGAVSETIEALALIDAVHARAGYGVAYNGVVPELSGDANVRLRSVRHPLLMAKYRCREACPEIVANDIVLDAGQRVLILSGPNAGGKTVLLKTIGLLCLMAQSGLPVTAGEGTSVPCFGSVFADIGDEQSLEQDLSTFSSHVARIGEILRDADGRSLVLLDELGSGTEPGEGAGLAAAVLEDLIARGCVTIVTTHHNALKLFGVETSGALNAAMELDPQTLKPTYRVIPGRPGRSYGLDMASRLGIPDQVIARARGRIGQDDVRLEKLLEQMEQDSRQLSSGRKMLEQDLERARQERSAAENALRAARDEARNIKASAGSEVREVVAELRRKLRELASSSSLDRAEIKKVTAETEALKNRLEPGTPRAHVLTAPSRYQFREGESVRIERLNKTGTVVLSNGNMLEIDVGGKKIKLAASEASPVKTAARPSAPAPGWGAELQSEEAPSDRLNIIGLHVPEALTEVDRFIDRAGFAHLSVVTIIHGLGTGVLRSAVTDFLKNHPLVASLRPGEAAEGGAGVTVAELKK